MARKDKPVKIKRYKNSMGGNTAAKATARKLIPLILAAVLVLAMGFLLGKPVLNFITGAGKQDDSSQPDTSSQIVSQISSALQEESRPRSSSQPQQDPASQPGVSADGQILTPSTEKDRVYYYVNSRNLTSEAAMDAVIAQMKTKGATHLVFDAKNPDGYVHYSSAHALASQLVADSVVDIAMLVKKLGENGLTPVARIYTFMDKMVSTVDRSTAVFYQGTDTRWLDSSAALGGKAWANPASKTMQDYILSLTDELLSMGVREFIYAGFSTPTGYSLDKRDFGATMEQVLANMKNLIGTLEAKISAKGGYSVWQIEYSAVRPEGSYAQYIVHPYQLGADDIIITARGSEIDVPAVVDTMKTVPQTEEISSITLWLTDNTNTDATQQLGSWFAY